MLEVGHHKPLLRMMLPPGKYHFLVIQNPNPELDHHESPNGCYLVLHTSLKFCQNSFKSLLRY